MHVFYLHGFASSARSTKAAFFAGRLAEHGLPLHTPDFNEPDFTTLTVSRMIAQVQRAVASLPEGPVVLIGSSLGAFVAVQTALATEGPAARIDRMILLAPALDFNGNRTRELGDRGLGEWESTGHLNVFHYGYGRVMPVHYGLYSDVCGYDCVNAKLTMPILIPSIPESIPARNHRSPAVDAATALSWECSRNMVTYRAFEQGSGRSAEMLPAVEACTPSWA